MTGWIRVDRDIWGHPFFNREPMSEREAWLWMLARAAYDDTRHKVGKHMLDVPRGTFMTTLRELQSVFMWRSDSRVRNFLARLEGEGMIERTTVGKRNAPKTHVSICNYEKYQTTERTKNAPKTHRERTKNAVNKQENNKQEEPKGSLPKRRSRLPDGWTLPMDWGEWAIEQGMDELAVRREAAQFEDHHRSKGNTMLDWRRAWQTWVRNHLKWRKTNSRQRVEPKGYTNNGAFGLIPERN